MEPEVSRPKREAVDLFGRVTGRTRLAVFGLMARGALGIVVVVLLLAMVEHWHNAEVLMMLQQVLAAVLSIVAASLLGRGLVAGLVLGGMAAMLIVLDALFLLLLLFAASNSGADVYAMLGFLGTPLSAVLAGLTLLGLLAPETAAQLGLKGAATAEEPAAEAPH